MSNNGIDYIIGKNGGEAPIVWTPNTCHNPHLIIGGSSGAGKTFTIRQIINAFVARGISFTILDKHGDIDGLEGIGEFNFGYGLGTGRLMRHASSENRAALSRAAVRLWRSRLADASTFLRALPASRSVPLALLHALRETAVTAGVLTAVLGGHP